MNTAHVQEGDNSGRTLGYSREEPIRNHRLQIGARSVYDPPLMSQGTNTAFSENSSPIAATYDPSLMSQGTNTPENIHGPRIVLTKLRASLAVTLLYSLAVLATALVFSWLAQQHDKLDTRYTTATIIFAVALAVFWAISIAVIHRRRT
ncbi:MAG TPA: hypothetical protein ENJ18_09065 [Nannocystis exedens]|nr:hypothetical protein [Nannocystis exedens]